MKIVTLVENSCGNEKCIAEHGLCIYIETQKHKLLLDTGQTDAVVKNAEALGIDLLPSILLSSVTVTMTIRAVYCPFQNSITLHRSSCKERQPSRITTVNAISALILIYSN